MFAFIIFFFFIFPIPSMLLLLYYPSTFICSNIFQCCCLSLFLCCCINRQQFSLNPLRFLSSSSIHNSLYLILYLQLQLMSNLKFNFAHFFELWNFWSIAWAFIHFFRASRLVQFVSIYQIFFLFELVFLLLLRNMVRAWGMLMH